MSSLSLRYFEVSFWYGRSRSTFWLATLDFSHAIDYAHSYNQSMSTQVPQYDKLWIEEIRYNPRLHYVRYIP